MRISVQSTSKKVFVKKFDVDSTFVEISTFDVESLKQELSFRHYFQHSQEPQNLQRFNRACGFTDKYKSAVIKYHQYCCQKFTGIKGKAHFDQFTIG